MYTPDNWVVIKASRKKDDDVHFRVLAGWSGGYLSGDSWRLNSGITKVSKDGEYYLFQGNSNSTYRLHKDSYGLRMNNHYVWEELQKSSGYSVSLLDNLEDWTKLEV